MHCASARKSTCMQSGNTRGQHCQSQGLAPWSASAFRTGQAKQDNLIDESMQGKQAGSLTCVQMQRQACNAARRRGGAAELESSADSTRPDSMGCPEHLSCGMQSMHRACTLPPTCSICSPSVYTATSCCCCLTDASRSILRPRAYSRPESEVDVRGASSRNLQEHAEGLCRVNSQDT